MSKLQTDRAIKILIFNEKKHNNLETFFKFVFIISFTIENWRRRRRFFLVRQCYLLYESVKSFLKDCHFLAWVHYEVSLTWIRKKEEVADLWRLIFRKKIKGNSFLRFFTEDPIFLPTFLFSVDIHYKLEGQAFMLRIFNRLVMKQLNDSKLVQKFLCNFGLY